MVVDKHPYNSRLDYYYYQVLQCRYSCLALRYISIYNEIKYISNWTFNIVQKQTIAYILTFDNAMFND